MRYDDLALYISRTALATNLFFHYLKASEKLETLLEGFYPRFHRSRAISQCFRRLQPIKPPEKIVAPKLLRNESGGTPLIKLKIAIFIQN